MAAGMPDFGVTDAGYVLSTQQQLLALMVADELATISPTADTSSDSALGQINGVVTRQLMIAYEAQQVVYGSNDPDVVEGFLLAQLAKLTGTAKLAATPSVVVLTCTLTIGTQLFAGATLAAVDGNPASVWTPQADYTAETGGAQPVTFVSTTTGPNEAIPNSITVITTPVTGWTAVNNADAAQPGTNVETDPDLRVRREEELTGGGAGSVDTIRAKLLKLVDRNGRSITSVDMLNNVTDAIDANGVPPHSFEAVIWDPTPLNNDDIAQLIWSSKSAGIQSFGSSSGTATDALGNPQLVSFTRVTQLPVYLAFGLTGRTAYPGDATFKANVVAACSGIPLPLPPVPGLVAPEETAFGVGDDVDPYDVVMNTAGLGALVTGLTMGFSAPGGTPTSISSTVLPIGTRQIAVFQTSQVTVNGV